VLLVRAQVLVHESREQRGAMVSNNAARDEMKRMTIMRGDA